MWYGRRQGTYTQKTSPLWGRLMHCVPENTKQKLMKVSRDSLESVDTIRPLRLKLWSDNVWVITDRLTVKLQADTNQLFSWHKDCRSNYMSKSKIERLRMTGQEGMTGQISSPSIAMSSLQNVSLWSKTSQIDWNQFIFCQQKKKSITSSHTRNERQQENIGSCKVWPVS